MARGASVVSRGVKSFSRVAKSFSHIAKSFSRVVKGFSHITKNFSYGVKGFSHIAKSFSRVVKGFSHIAKNFSYGVKSFSHIAKNFSRAAGLLACSWCAVSCYGDGGGGGGGADAALPGSGGGTGGSMARFTLSGDFLYTVDDRTLKVFDVSVESDPLYMRSKDQELGSGAETIFALDTLLLVGSQEGMYIFNIARPEFPDFLSLTLHVTSCDPVVAAGGFAYVTLNSTNAWCGRMSNLLQVYDISNPRSPELLLERPMGNPRGLGVSGGRLFVCDNGVKVFDLADPSAPTWVDDLDHVREVEGLDAYDVIPLGDHLLVIGQDGLYQFSGAGDRLAFVSKMEVKREAL
jgi:hypothetical protein